MIGLTQTDAVLGKRTKWSELYPSYSERYFVKFDNENATNFSYDCKELEK